MTRKQASGFTLIELMMVVTIVGVIASMAMPTYTRLTLRSKQSERHEVMLRIKKAVADYYVQHGSTKDADGNSLKVNPQPATMPGGAKLQPNWKDPEDHWVDVFRTAEEIEGSLYYQYYFECTEPAANAPATLTITSVGDLDADGDTNTRWVKYTRMDGAYVILHPAPCDGDVCDEGGDPDSIF